ncbi:hypothetical protein [Rhizobium sp. PEPV16]|uniref:hypothetical protein n=1 Tax=Rhizobium sp. PEPV16 TaxID=1820614 RepID=UPI00124F2FA8|nr:hypothetical protein [Rhizobium sp. PEPV16]KAF5884954.1 hypothetical protein FY112_13455 [Rhizobium sp. PEPV16]
MKFGSDKPAMKSAAPKAIIATIEAAISADHEIRNLNRHTMSFRRRHEPLTVKPAGGKITILHWPN